MPPKPNGTNPPALTAETIVVMNVLHFADGTASSTLHVAGPLLSRPKMVAAMLHDHANELANSGPKLELPGG